MKSHGEGPGDDDPLDPCRGIALALVVCAGFWLALAAWWWLA